MNDLLKQASAIIKRAGGYREKAILNNKPVLKIIQWDPCYHVIRLTDKDNNTLEIELNSGRITG